MLDATNATRVENSLREFLLSTSAWPRSRARARRHALRARRCEHAAKVHRARMPAVSPLATQR
jgi:hypothetical protein